MTFWSHIDGIAPHSRLLVSQLILVHVGVNFYLYINCKDSKSSKEDGEGIFLWTRYIRVLKNCPSHKQSRKLPNSIKRLRIA